MSSLARHTQLFFQKDVYKTLYIINPNKQFTTKTSLIKARCKQTQQQLSTLLDVTWVCKRMQQHAIGCAQLRNISSIQQCWELWAGNNVAWVCTRLYVNSTKAQTFKKEKKEGEKRKESYWLLCGKRNKDMSKLKWHIE